MTCSPARLAANQRNAQKSTGPKSDEGKARSRGNALKHGLTGEGVVLPEGDAAEVEALAAEFVAEMKPSGAMGRMLLRRVALLSTRLDRCARHDDGMTAKRVRDAVTDRDNARHDEVDALGAGLAANPSRSTRLLQQTPEGIDWLIRAWLAVRGELGRTGWGEAQAERVDHLLGRVRDEYPPTEFAAPGRVLMGGDLAGADDDQRAWASERLASLIDDEVEWLRALRESVDGEDEAADRAEAPSRALFDASREGQLARKYEAAAERAMMGALREFRKVEERAGTVAAPEPAPAPVPPPPAGAPRPVPIPASAAVAGWSPAPSQTNPIHGGWVPALGCPDLSIETAGRGPIRE